MLFNLETLIAGTILGIVIGVAGSMFAQKIYDNGRAEATRSILSSCNQMGAINQDGNIFMCQKVKGAKDD